MYMYLNRVIIVLLLVHNFKVKCDAVHMYIEEVYKKNGSWDFLVRQIFVFVDLFAHGGSNCRLYFPCTVPGNCFQRTEIFCVFCPSVTI